MLLSYAFFLGQVSLHVVLGVIFELSVQIFILKLDPLLLLARLPLKVLTSLVPTVEFLDHQGCIGLFFFLLLI